VIATFLVAATATSSFFLSFLLVSMDAKSPSNNLRPIAGGNSTPRKLSELMTAFGASPSPTSSSSLRKQIQSRAEVNNMAASNITAGNTIPPPSPAPAQTASVADRKEESHSDDELHSGDVIHGTVLGPRRLRRICN
jgi:hypothetical protein